MTSIATLTKADYAEAFKTEREKTYPVIDAFEAQNGFAIGQRLLLMAAEILACPVKANPPNWQHGRVLYAAVRRYLEDSRADPYTTEYQLLDVGTAKGFSALCMQIALRDSLKGGKVTSVDVIDPEASLCRNSIVDVARGPLTLAQTIGYTGLWNGYADRIDFHQCTGIDWLSKRSVGRIHVAFIDGKHTGHVVLQEGKLLAERQRQGDLAIFDDVHIPDVSVAVNCLQDRYRLRYIEVLPNRHYAIGVRR